MHPLAGLSWLSAGPWPYLGGRPAALRAQERVGLEAGRSLPACLCSEPTGKQRAVLVCVSVKWGFKFLFLNVF